MGTMSGSPCLHYDCSNRNSFGYCKTTACINEHYQREQWGLPSTTNKSESVVIKPQTNADRIRSMTDEELAAHMVNSVSVALLRFGNIKLDGNTLSGYIDCWLDWLKQEVNNGQN